MKRVLVFPLHTRALPLLLTTGSLLLFSCTPRSDRTGGDDSPRSAKAQQRPGGGLERLAIVPDDSDESEDDLNFSVGVTVESREVNRYAYSVG